MRESNSRAWWRATEPRLLVRALYLPVAVAMIVWALAIAVIVNVLAAKLLMMLHILP